MRDRICAFLVAILVGACATTNTPPTAVDPAALASIRSLRCEVNPGLVAIAVDYDSVDVTIGLVAAVGKAFSTKQDGLKEAVTALDTSENRARIQAYLLDDIRAKLRTAGVDCAGGPSDPLLAIAPEFVGYRYDQVENVIYAPTILARFSVISEGALLFDHRIGVGNLSGLGRIRKLGTAAARGYNKPANIADDLPKALEGLEVSIALVDDALVRYLRPAG